MRVFITGTTGYLGKHVLARLLADDRITEVLVSARTKRTHPHPKVRILNVDLSNPGFLAEITRHSDRANPIGAVIHLAGLYDFQESYGNCYANNVLPTQHLVQHLRELNRERHVPLLMASTYAVTHGKAAELAESPLRELPSRKIPYAFTKAVAERIVTDSGIPALVFRLGILTGRASDGAVEKADGAYTFVHWLAKFAGSRAFRRLPKRLQMVPLLGDPNGILPLVPVDAAADVFHRGLFMAPEAGARIFGVYDESSVRISEFCAHLLGEFAPEARGVYVKRLPSAALSCAPYLLSMSRDALSFALRPVRLANPAFRAEFGAATVPSYASYREAFMRGYLRHAAEEAGAV